MGWVEYPYRDYNDYNLDWVIKTVKELMEAWDSYNRSWEETEAYVMNYFRNLDLTAEVRNIVDGYIVDGTISTLIAAQMGQFEHEVDVLSARLSNIEAAPTPGGSELTDIRVAWDSATYTSAGDSVRAQVEDAVRAYGKYTTFSCASLMPANTDTINGVTFTYDGNGHIDFTGTASSNAVFPLVIRGPITHYMPLLGDYVYTCKSSTNQCVGQLIAQYPDLTYDTIIQGDSDGYVFDLRPTYVSFTLRIIIYSGWSGSGSCDINVQSRRATGYTDLVIKQEILNDVIAADPNQNQALRIDIDPVTEGGIDYQVHDGRIYYSGTRMGSSIFQMLDASDIAPFVAGETFYISYNGNGVMYLQLLVDGNQILSGLDFDGEPVTIPNTFTTFNFRVLINADGTYNSSAPLEIRRNATGATEIQISTASDLYDFLQAPKRDTIVVLSPGTYDLYTGLYETDILADNTTAVYLADVEIKGNGAVLSLEVPSVVALAHTAACNIVSGLTVGGNIKVHDLTVQTRNVRYALHDESLGTASNYNTVHEYENVYFNQTVDTGVGVVGNTIGIGGSQGQRYCFRNCVFEHNGIGNPIFYIHGRTYNIAELLIQSCKFVPRASGHALSLNQYTGNTTEIPVNIVDTYLGSIVSAIQGGGITDAQWKITAINSYITAIYVSTAYTSFPTPERINTISGTVDTSYQTF